MNIINALKNITFREHTIDLDFYSNPVKLRVHTPFEKKLFTNHEEKPILDKFSGLLLPDDIIYDIGSHAGYHSVYLASQLKNGKVIAFEPNPNCYEYLEENIDLNPQLNIFSENVAISNNNGVADFSFGAPYERSARLENNPEWNVIKTKIIALDEYSKNHEAPTVLKIDVEGAEDLVINGAKQMLKNVRMIFLELHLTMIQGGKEGAQHLRNEIIEFGFKETFVQPRRDEMHIFYEK